MEIQTPVLRLCDTLYDQYKEDILTAREKLYQYLKNRHNENIANQAKEYLEKHSDMSPTPLFGEMAPWLCKKIFPVYSGNPSKDFDEILIRWLCVYLLMSLFNKDKVATSLTLPLTIEARAYLNAEYAHRLATAKLGSKDHIHNADRNMYLKTLIEKISAISAYPHEEYVSELVQQITLFIQCTDDIAHIEKDLVNGQPSSIISSYMLVKKSPTFLALLSEPHPSGPDSEQILKHVQNKLRRLSTNAGSLASTLQDCGREINSDLKKYEPFGIGPLSYNLEVEQNFFTTVRNKARELEDAIGTFELTSDENKRNNIIYKTAENIDAFSLAM
jgi:hypothetical protein